MSRKKAIREAARRKQKRIFIRDKGRCQYCKHKCLIPKLLWHPKVRWFGKFSHHLELIVNYRHVVIRTGTIDHIIPVKDGGASEEHNLVLACSVCNEKRRDESDLQTESFEQSVLRQNIIPRCSVCLTCDTLHESGLCKECRVKKSQIGLKGGL